MNSNTQDFKRKIKKITDVIGLVGFVIFIGVLLLLVFPREYSLSRYGQYTDGYIDSISVDWDYDKTVHYSFRAIGKRYSGTAGYHAKIKPKVGQKFKVKYSRKNPEYNRMIIK